MFFNKKKATKPSTIDIDMSMLQSNLEKSRKLNESMMDLSTGFLASSNQMLNATRKEVKRV